MDKSQYLAACMVSAVLHGRSLSQLLEESHSGASLPPSQRAAVQHLSYGTLRYYGRLDAILDQLLERPLQDERVHCLLLVALYQLEYGRASAHAVVDHAVRATSRFRLPWGKGLVNAVLRNFLRRRNEILARLDADEVAHFSYPQWWIDKLRAQYPAHWQAILEAGNQQPPMVLRVNCRRTTVNAYLAQLAAAGIAGKPLSGWAVMLEKPLPVEVLPGFREGMVSVQDYGAQLATPLLDLADGMRVLDACSAPGGKAGHILECADVSLTALDCDEARIKRTRSNLERLKLAAQLVKGDAAKPQEWWDGRPFDRILADVPCSASGIVRRRVDSKWLRRPEDVQAFASQQARILRALWPLLAKGGKLLYATCSVFAEENQQQINAFRHEQTDAQLLSLPGLTDGQLLPCAEHDGFYYALLQKL